MVAGAAISGSAQAQTFSRYRNANTAHGTFYLGVSGGEVCDPANEKCGVKAGTQLITYQKSGDDQQWELTLPQGGYVYLQDLLGDPWTNDGTCINVVNRSTSQGANLEIESAGCIGDPTARWRPVQAEDLGAPYPGCYAFQDLASGLYMGVSGGNVQNGSHVIQWPLCIAGSNACGGPAGFHPDQFWCPETP
ncbi:MAG TPA: RICIN domain-containing protein [Polyangia bacterium]|nr:RICIN domain-containing protein [Polyangia bacterium]